MAFIRKSICSCREKKAWGSEAGIDVGVDTEVMQNLEQEIWYVLSIFLQLFL